MIIMKKGWAANVVGGWELHCVDVADDKGEEVYKVRIWPTDDVASLDIVTVKTKAEAEEVVCALAHCMRFESAKEGFIDADKLQEYVNLINGNNKKVELINVVLFMHQLQGNPFGELDMDFEKGIQQTALGAMAEVIAEMMEAMDED